ncbi:type VII secretion system-associated protein [Nocardia sp. NPDC059180]|uniref:type VII secretion system-associated protein n=1 Tax=Nocardia sp. NPDC059180 TaxID=3346761 RepID=UPI0036799524
MVRKPVPGAVRQDNWFVLLDPKWQASSPGEVPPAAVIAGGWLLDEAGETGPFQPNPDYAPRDPSTPTDPTDAVLRLIADGEQLGEQLVQALCDSVVQIACDRNNAPVVGSAPDGLACVFVATAMAHQHGVSADRWWPVVGAELPGIVPAGADILLNPGGPAEFRLVTDALRRAD